MMKKSLKQNSFKTDKIAILKSQAVRLGITNCTGQKTSARQDAFHAPLTKFVGATVGLNR